jgi:hypothetical protein
MIITKKNRRGDIILDSKCHIEQPIINWEKQCGIHYREKKVFEYRNANLLRDDEVIQFGMRCNTCQVRFKNFQNGTLQFSTNDVSEEMKNYMKDMVETQHGNKKCKVRQRTKREKKTKVLVPIPNHTCRQEVGEKDQLMITNMSEYYTLFQVIPECHRSSYDIDLESLKEGVGDDNDDNGVDDGGDDNENEQMDIDDVYDNQQVNTESSSEHQTTDVSQTDCPRCAEPQPLHVSVSSNNDESKNCSTPSFGSAHNNARPTIGQKRPLSSTSISSSSSSSTSSSSSSSNAESSSANDGNGDTNTALRRSNRLNEKFWLIYFR